MIGNSTKTASFSGFLAILGTAVLCPAQLPRLDSSSSSAPAAVLYQTSAKAQTQAEPSPAERAREIPLRRSSSPGPGAELWEQANDNRSVRNVTVATLTPVLPDPSKATGTAVIVAPGGAFMELEMDAEGYKVANQLAERGISAFVLKYRLDPTPSDHAAFRAEITKRVMAKIASQDDFMGATAAAAEDADAAVRLVRSRANEWGVDPHHIGFIGFSAGAITALNVGLTGDKASRPDFIGPFYGPMPPQPVPADAPPAFFAIALDDPVFGVGRSMGIIDAWRKAGRPVEAHLYTKGGHGFAGRPRTKSTELWFDEFYAWMRDLGFIPK